MGCGKRSAEWSNNGKKATIVLCNLPPDPRVYYGALWVAAFAIGWKSCSAFFEAVSIIRRYVSPGVSGSAVVPEIFGRIPFTGMPYERCGVGTELESDTKYQIACGYLLVWISLAGITCNEVSLSL